MYLPRFLTVYPFGLLFALSCTHTSEKAMAPHSSTLAWKIPWTEEPGRLQSMGSLRVGHDWATSLSLCTFMHWRRKVNPLQYSCLENPRDRGAWRAAVYGVAQSRTRLKWLSSSSSSTHTYTHTHTHTHTHTQCTSEPLDSKLHLSWPFTTVYFHVYFPRISFFSNMIPIIS